ncbi:MAG: hypothetical protein CXX81_06710 [Methanobacteriota archaeon]|nr:MAG: hypothetical protein CXX81_06710 [Euryarchaeota archaeon]
MAPEKGATLEKGGISPKNPGPGGPKKKGGRFVGPYWPRQSLLHGCVLGVEWNNSKEKTTTGYPVEITNTAYENLGPQFGENGEGGQYANRSCTHETCSKTPPCLPAFWGANPVKWDNTNHRLPSPYSAAPDDKVPNAMSAPENMPYLEGMFLKECPDCGHNSVRMSTKANPGDVDIGIGHTQQEALAAVISTQGDGSIEERSVLEEHLVGFSQGLLGELDNPDGEYQFEQSVHQYTFEADSAGDIHDYAPSEFTTDEGDSVKNMPCCLDCDMLLDEGIDVCPNDPTHELGMSRDPKVATYAAPRYFEPKDPALVLTNTLRSSRHGGDGNHSDDSTLKCRLTGQYFEGWTVTFAAAYYLNMTMLSANLIDVKTVGNSVLPDHGAIPVECYELHQEVAKMDVTTYLCGGTNSFHPNWEVYFNVFHQLTHAFASTELGQSYFHWWQSFTPLELQRLGPITQELLDIVGSSFHHGTLPSPVSVNTWSPAWIPMYLDYKIKYTPHRHVLGNNNWNLSDPDFDINGDVGDLIQQSSDALTLEGRSLLTDSTGAVIVSQLERLLEEEVDLEKGDAEINIKCSNEDCSSDGQPVDVSYSITENDEVVLITSDCPHCETGILSHDSNDSTPLGALTPQEEEEIENLADTYTAFDLLSVTFDDLNKELQEKFPNDALRAGIMEIEDLKVIDAYGQILEIDPTIPGQKPSIALSMETRNQDDSERNEFLLKPRIQQGARLKFQLLSSDDDTTPANAGTEDMAGVTANTPVCAFLLPDHIEWAMEVFDKNGDARGQLRVAERTWEHGGIQKGRLAWDPAPGSETGIGQLPNSGNPSADAFLNKLLEMSIQNEVDNPEVEGVLSSLLRAIDTTYWDMDPFGKGGDDIPSMFMGRPVAITRAKVCLEIDERDQPMNDELRKSVFEIRLGALSKITDGLLGYFVNDDYSKFMSVYPTDVNGVPDTPQLYGDALSHDFLEFDPTIEVRPGQEVMLTLLMNPQSSVHVTSGILPQKEITLVRSHYEQAMNKIAPTFKIGPVLVDPQTVKMPIPDQRGLQWSWVFKESYTDWVEQPISDVDQLAGLPKKKTTAFEGWIKLDIDESQNN